MKVKRISGFLLATVLSITSITAFADWGTPPGLLIMPSPTQKVAVLFDGDALGFDVAPIIEDGRTLVPFRVIFETMGCAVDYFESESGTKTVSAHRGNDALSLNIGEPRMYFNGEEIALDVPAKIKDGRTLVPIRAISEAFKCEVLWDKDTKTVSIYSPAGHFNIKPAKLEKTITDEEGRELVSVLAYYPVIENPDEIPIIDDMNSDYKWCAEQIIVDAQEIEADARFMLEQMGDKFIPFEFQLTYEENYNSYGVVSITEYLYQNIGGAHPTTTIESRSFSAGAEDELSLSTIIDEEYIGGSLRDYVYNLFSKKLEELGIEPDESGMYDVIDEEMGDVQYYLENRALTLYFNQGQIAPYALGVISVEVPYDEAAFFVDMRHDCLDEFTYQVENDRGYEWIVTNYSEDKLAVTEEYEKYDEEELLSEYYPVGMKTVRVKGIKEGNATVELACVEEGKDASEAIYTRVMTFYVNESNKITAVTDTGDVSLLQ